MGWGDLLSSFATGFGSGFAANYAIERWRERRAFSRNRSRDIFQPIHEQFVEVLTEIEAHQRPNHLNRAFWQSLKASNLIDVLRPDLRSRLEDIYENLAPRYDTLWRSLNGTEVPKLMTHLGERYGKIRPYQPNDPQLPKWWRFLGSETFRPSLLDLANGDDVQLWNRYFVDLSKLDIPDKTMNEFLRMCWEQASLVPNIVALRQAHSKLLQAISVAMRDIKKKVIH